MSAALEHAEEHCWPNRKWIIIILALWDNQHNIHWLSHITINPCFWVVYCSAACHTSQTTSQTFFLQLSRTNERKCSLHQSHLPLVQFPVSFFLKNIGNLFINSRTNRHSHPHSVCMDVWKVIMQMWVCTRMFIFSCVSLLSELFTRRRRWRNNRREPRWQESRGC